MASSQISKIDLLSRLAEVKRIFTVIEPSVKESACLVVTSGAHGEGKTTVCAGLAISAAKKGSGKVLALDFNWYAPMLHELFGVQLSEDDGFLGGENIAEYIRKTSLEFLDILPAPKKTPVNSQSKNLVSQELIDRLKGMYDIIFVDTSSVYPTNQRMIDPVEISRFSDGVIMVTLTNVTPRQELKKALSAIETAGAGILGVVANQWLNPLI